MKPATSSSFLYLGIPAAVVLLFALVATRLPRPSRPAPVPYLTIGGGPCSGGTRLCPDGTCQSPGAFRDRRRRPRRGGPPPLPRRDLPVARRQLLRVELHRLYPLEPAELDSG